MSRSIFRVVFGLAVLATSVLAQDAEQLRASHLIKMEVRNASYDVIGEVRDVVLDRQTGGPAYAVVAFTRIPSKAGRLYAVPWRALTQTADRRALVLGVSNDVLANVPGFDPKNWPDMTDAKWAARTAAAYRLGIRPELGWIDDEARVIGVLETVRVAQRPARLNAVFEGTVSAMYPGEISEVVVSTDLGDLDAVLGPIAYLDEQKLAFDQNVNVKLRGRTAIANDRPMFVATHAMTRPGQWVRLRTEDLTPAWTTTVAEPGRIRDITGTVTYAGNGSITVLTDSEGLRNVSIAPSNYVESRHWRIEDGHPITVTGYDDANTREFVAITADYGHETWRFRLEDGRPLWK